MKEDDFAFSKCFACTSVLLWNVNRQNQIKLSFSPSINLQLPAGLNWAYCIIHM